MSDERHDDQIDELARRRGPWILLVVILLGLGAFALAWWLTPANSAFRAPNHPEASDQSDSSGP